MRVQQPWTSRQWCHSVVDPTWPFAYSKYEGQLEERKGRVSVDKQDVRHNCTSEGVRSKCHICEGEGGHNNSNNNNNNTVTKGTD